MEFSPIKSFEPITQSQLNMIAKSLGMMQSMVLRIGEVDLESGAGIIDDNTKCLWTKKGCRITLSIGFGGFTESVSKLVDPGKP